MMPVRTRRSPLMRMRPGRRWRRRLAALAALALAAAALAGCGAAGEQGRESGSLLEVLGDRHIHSLWVEPGDTQRLLIGIHGGLYRSSDGGRSWTPAGLDGQDAMNVVGSRGGAPLWVAGHEVLERSRDGGRSFEPVRPVGLPGLDLHGFAVRPGRPHQLAAAVAGQGLYRSSDGGRTFVQASRAVGGGVFGMSLAPDGTLLAADPQVGILISRDGGSTFAVALARPGMVSVAVHPRRPAWIIAGGEPGLAVSEDGGRTWTMGRPAVAVAAVAADLHDARSAWAVRASGVLLHTRDGGHNWSPVS